MFFDNPEDRAKLKYLIKQWFRWDKNADTLAEVQQDIDNQRYEKLRIAMLNRLKFGTAGLRASMAAGFNHMNDVVVIQSAMGFCAYLGKKVSRETMLRGIVIGYDGRHNSKRFAHLSAKVFVTHGMPVYLFSEVCPTPFVSFGILQYRCAGGIMVTASHNPKEDNGYKVYWGNGAQITAPHDEGIEEQIALAIQQPKDEYWEIENLFEHELISDCYDEVTDEYMRYLTATLGEEVLKTNKEADVRIVYSAMHGVGHKYIERAFEAVNLPLPLSVYEQQEPDPEFPTVRFPNPEERDCLELSQRLADENDVRLILVNDPDADRLAVAEYNSESPSKFCKIFNGNEMGVLLGWWLLEQYKKNPVVEPEHTYFLASVVSSKMLRTLAEMEGFNFIETLTGFKWMGNTALALAEKNKLPLFAFEEAIGYMCNARVPDKDGISAAVHVASMASHLYSKGSSLQAQLQCLYRRYGYHITHNSYFLCEEKSIIKKIFHRIRNFHGEEKYPQIVGSNEIISMHDMSCDVHYPHYEGALPTPIAGSGLDLPYVWGEMIMFRCQNGLSVTIRTSGTEPKLKYYTEFVAEAETQTEQGQVKIRLLEMVEEFIEDLIQPREYGLRWRTLKRDY